MTTLFERDVGTILEKYFKQGGNIVGLVQDLEEYYNHVWEEAYYKGYSDKEEDL